MTGKTNNNIASENFESISQKPFDNVYTRENSISIDLPAAPQRPVFIYPPNTLPAELRARINEKWEACWPINTLKPLVLIDLICYLLFIKKLEEKKLIIKDELNWSRFKNMDAQSMHTLFTRERGIVDIIKNYSNENRQYSLFVRKPLLIIPTAKLLANMVDIVEIMEAQGDDEEAAVFDYLLLNARIAGQNGQVPAPDYVLKLIVALMKPSPEDMILDPASGNGSFLVKSSMYIDDKANDANTNSRKKYDTPIYNGIETDLIQLRIGAINMILHGMDDPKLSCLNVFNLSNLSLRQQPTLILSNLFFENQEVKAKAKENALPAQSHKQEITFLKLIIKNLKNGGRAAVIIREILLHDNKTEIRDIRRQIIEGHKLAGVIALPGKTGTHFSGASVLIFNKQEHVTTDKVWFYKMELVKKETNKNEEDAMAGGENHVFTCIEEEYDNVHDILNRWANKEEEILRKRTDKSFYVPVDEIRTNNYSLSLNDYRTNIANPGLEVVKKNSSPDKKIAFTSAIKENEKIDFIRARLSTTSKFLLKKVSVVGLETSAILRTTATNVVSGIGSINFRKNILPVAANFSSKFLHAIKIGSHESYAFIKKISAYLKRSGLVISKRLTTITLKILANIRTSFLKIFPEGFSTIIHVRLLTIVIVALGLSLGVAAFYFISPGKAIVNASPLASKSFASAGKTKKQSSGKARILSQEQIKAILSDTIGIINFESKFYNTANVTDSNEVFAYNNKPSVTSNNKEIIKNNRKIQYTAADTAFFHDEPNENTKRKTYLDPLKNNVLDPIKERNGFIYIVYTNHSGRTSKGWINKQDLIPLPN